MPTELSSQLTRSLTTTVSSLGSEDFGNCLLAFLRATVDFDSAVILAYPEQSSVVVLHDELSARDRELFEGPYRNGLYLLSPLYQHAHGGTRGYFHIRDIAPEGFTDSEFYQLYYSANGSIDHVAYLCESSTGTPIVVSLERTEAFSPFDDGERSRLAGLEELVFALVNKQQWTNTTVDPSAMPRDMHAHLQHVLELFGSTVLTPRERDVVRLILRGYPSKSVARELSISTQTEQVHRKNIYQKLGISSHSELFTLFFDAIAQPGAEQDPLLALRP
jgi:DNA-binding CsgD family transcriptional regulator